MAPSPPVSTETKAKPAIRRRLWKITKPLLIAYLSIVLGMMLFETSLVYPIPDRSSGEWRPKSFQFEDIHFNSADGTELHGWFIPHPAPKQAILYCHGNGDDMSSVGELAAMLSESLQASVFIFDYRGYGHSQGRPDETGCIADGNAAQHWLAERAGIRPNDVVLMGRSLGSAVAIALAADNGAQALVIENAFPTMTDFAAFHYSWLPVRWIMSNRYDNLTRIQRYTGPLLQSHGTRDELIPLPFARRLFDIAPSVNKRWMEFPGLEHNSAMPRQYYYQLGKFLDASAKDAHLPKPP
jgi:fermentation-respiration switch protein FrsA (DUF1100 family)